MKKNEVAKSSLLIQKEKELKDIQKKKEKVSTTIRNTKVKLSDLQSEIERYSKEMINGMSRTADLGKLAKEMKALMAELKKKVKLSKKDKNDIDDVLGNAVLDDITETVDSMFGQNGFGSAEDFQSGNFGDPNADTDEFNRQRRTEMFGQFAVKLDEGEQQQIRKVFLELANRFHPDKATNEQELKLFNDVMQSINGAYQSGDLQELLDIKERFKSYQTSDASADYDIPVLDVLESHISKNRNELNLLENQLERLKEEFKNLKSSELGDMVKQNKKMEKQGGDSSEFNAQTKNLFDLMEEMKKILIEWMETGKRPAMFNQFADGTHPLIQNMQSPNMFDFDDDDDEGDFDLDNMSREEIEEMMALFSMLNQAAAKQKSARRRR
jgi:chromosome segregation ATPase